MFERLEVMRKTYLAIQEKLASGITDVAEITKLMKELKKLEDAVVAYEKYLELQQQLKDLEELLELEDDPSVLDMAKTERHDLEQQLDELHEKLRILLIPKDPDDDKNVVIEIKGAAGGDEGNIFAGDLYRMYAKYAESMGWKVQVINTTPGTSGGFAGIEFIVSGENTFSFLKYESGVHRVQRVPETESQGRIHTSTAVVLALPEQEEIEYDIKWEDIRFDTYNSSGAGGQSVNTTYSAVRLTHIPTGIVVSIQNERSQIKNKETAMQILKSKLIQKEMEEKQAKLDALKGEKSDIGWGSQIRSYVFQPYQMVKDHRTNYEVGNIQSVMDGEIDGFINAYLKSKAYE